LTFCRLNGLPGSKIIFLRNSPIFGISDILALIREAWPQAMYGGAIGRMIWQGRRRGDDE